MNQEEVRRYMYECVDSYLDAIKERSGPRSPFNEVWGQLPLSKQKITSGSTTNEMLAVLGDYLRETIDKPLKVENERVSS